MNGWKGMNFLHRLLIMLMPFMFTSTQAEETQLNSEYSEVKPGVEFFEYLGEWETDEGEWIDPEEFDNDLYAREITLKEGRQDDE